MLYLINENAQAKVQKRCVCGGVRTRGSAEKEGAEVRVNVYGRRNGSAKETDGAERAEVRTVRSTESAHGRERSGKAKRRSAYGRKRNGTRKRTRDGAERQKKRRWEEGTRRQEQERREESRERERGKSTRRKSARGKEKRERGKSTRKKKRIPKNDAKKRKGRKEKARAEGKSLHRPRKELPMEEIRKLYLEKKLSQCAIGKIYKVHPATIAKRLREMGVEIRRL